MSDNGPIRFPIAHSFNTTSTMTILNNLCIYCGSSSGRRDVYADAARALAETLVQRNIGLVYGGAGIGLMGTLADRVLELGGRVVGVIPHALAKKEVAHPRLTELHITQSMHDRKTMMAELSDGFIALPGGLGTLEELFEIWTWAQLGFHQKPCGLLNVDGYYDLLIDFLDQAAAEQFVSLTHRSMLRVENNPEILIDRLVEYQAPAITRWVVKDET